MAPKRNAPAKEVDMPSKRQRGGRQSTVPASKADKASTKQQSGVREDLLPLYLALSDVASLSAPTRAMLLEAVPHALGTPLAERHDYQKEVLGHVDELLKAQMSEREASFQEAHKEYTLKEAERDAEAKKASEFKESATTMRKASDAKEQEVREAKQAVKDANSEKETRSAELEALKGKLAAEVETRTSFEKTLQEELPPLKAGGFSHWQFRNKCITAFTSKLEPLGLDESFINALAVVFKTKPSDHGAFAVATLEHATKYFDNHLQKLQGSISATEDEVAQATERVTAAGAVIDEKTAAEKAVQEESFSLQNQWVEEDQKRFEADQSLKAVEMVLQEHEREKNQKEKALKETQNVISAFETLQDPPAEPAALDKEMVPAATDAIEDPEAMAMEVAVPAAAMVEAC